MIYAGGAPELVPGDAEGAGAAVESTDIAVDLDGRAPDDALKRGREAVAALPVSLLRLGTARLAAGDTDDAERLVPAYAVAPRGAPKAPADAGVAWSRDPR